MLEICLSVSHSVFFSLTLSPFLSQPVFLCLCTKRAHDEPVSDQVKRKNHGLGCHSCVFTRQIMSGRVSHGSGPSRDGHPASPFSLTLTMWGTTHHWAETESLFLSLRSSNDRCNLCLSYGSKRLLRQKSLEIKMDMWYTIGRTTYTFYERKTFTHIYDLSAFCESSVSFSLSISSFIRYSSDAFPTKGGWHQDGGRCWNWDVVLYGCV